MGGGKGAIRPTIETLIFLVVLVATLIFLTVYLGLLRMKGITAAGTASLTVELEYSDERAILYLTDEYGNKLTDLIGQALLLTNPELTVTGDVTAKPISDYARDTEAYKCAAGSLGGTYDPVYKVSRVDLNRYLRCIVIPNKLGQMYGGKDNYCIFAVYDAGGTGRKTAVFGNDKLPNCEGGQIVSAEIAPPPGFTKRIKITLEKA